MLSLLVNATLTLGRPVMRVVLWPVVLYFWLTGKRLRRASREYLARALGREPTAMEVLRHFHTFGVVFIDRVYLLGGRRQALDIEAHVPEEVLQAFNARHGCLLLVAHFGSFEVLRIKGMLRDEAPIRIVLDRRVGRMAMSLLEQLDPVMASRIIDASRRGPELVLDIKQAIEAGDIVGMMADRARADERSLVVRFLGGEVRVPAGPWIVAGTLGVPVILGFGIFRGGRRYECRLELFAPRIELSRSTRDQALQQHAQRFAARLEEQVRASPFNWFNFFDYWLDEPAARDEPAAH
jgi:predicted LPLAT superfamily acyltransferase